MLNLKNHCTVAQFEARGHTGHALHCCTSQFICIMIFTINIQLSYGLLGASCWQRFHTVPKREVRREPAITPDYFTNTMEANLAADRKR